MMKSMVSHSKNDTLAALGALSIFLSLIEHVIPKPIPFLRIGLANIPILISLMVLNPKETLKLIIIKSLGSSLLSGTLFSWLSIYSITGSLISGAVTITLKALLKNRISLIGLSVTGAFINNLTQLFIAYIILGSGVKYFALPILITGLVSGITLGIFANKFIKQSVWVRRLLSKQ